MIVVNKGAQYHIAGLCLVKGENKLDEKQAKALKACPQYEKCLKSGRLVEGKVAAKPVAKPADNPAEGQKRRGK
jgi:hypothetical protein